jgi:electron transport complex protein RnfG
MNQMLKLFVAVLLFSAVSGGLLAGVKSATEERIEMQQILFVKGPAINEILKGSSIDPLANRFKIKDGKEERNFFPAVFNGKANIVAMEAFGKGFGGDIGLIVAVNLDTDEIEGVAVTTLRETPGVGTRVKSEKSFTKQFKGKSIKEPLKVKSDGGTVDAVSGATVSSKGVAGGVVAAGEFYARLKTAIIEKTKSIKA